MNKKQRFILHDAVLGTSFYECWFEHEGINAIERRYSWDDAMLQATALCSQCNDLHGHPRGHSSWRESTMMKFMNIQNGTSWRTWWWWSDENSWRDYRFRTRNLAWVGSNLERTEKILGMTTMDIFLKNWCRPRARIGVKGSWHNQSPKLRSSQRRSMKQGYVRLCSTAEQEQIDGVHSEGIDEIVPMQDTVDLHRRLL